MSEPVPVEPSAGASIIASLNLPQLLAGEAGKAFSRLLGGILDIPAAWLERPAAVLRAKTSAQVDLIKSSSRVIEERLQTDEQLFLIAAANFFPKEIRRALNKAAVVSEAAKSLELMDAKNTGDCENNVRTNSEIEDDFLNIFERYAEDASSERMRVTWGRILAREIKKSGSFSAKTLRVVSEIRTETALAFQRVVPLVYGSSNRNMIGNLDPSGFISEEISSLEDAGLITGVSGGIHSRLTIVDGSVTLPMRSGVLLVNFSQMDGTMQMPAYALTEAGRECLDVVEHVDDKSVLLSKFHGIHPDVFGTRVKSIDYFRLNESGNEPKSDRIELYKALR